MKKKERLSKLERYERSLEVVERQYLDACDKKDHKLMAKLLDTKQRLNGQIVMAIVDQ